MMGQKVISLPGEDECPWRGFLLKFRGFYMSLASIIHLEKNQGENKVQKRNLKFRTKSHRLLEKTVGCIFRQCLLIH